MSQAPHGTTPPTWPASEPALRSGHSRLPIITAISIALIAVAIAIGSWFRPVPKPEAPLPKTYSAQEVADAKQAVCGAYGTVRAMLEVNSRNTGDTDVDKQIVAVNTRLAIHVAGEYLNFEVLSQPAVPPDVAISLRELADAYRTIAINQLGQAGRTKLDSNYAAAESYSVNVTKACGE